MLGVNPKRHAPSLGPPVSQVFINRRDKRGRKFSFLIYFTPIRQQLFSALNLMSVEFWTGIQSEYEVAMAKNRIEDRLDREIRPYKAA